MKMCREWGGRCVTTRVRMRIQGRLGKVNEREVLQMDSDKSDGGDEGGRRLVRRRRGEEEDYDG